MSENVEMGYVLSAGVEATGMLIKGTAKAAKETLKLLQLILKRVHTGMLSAGEYEDLKKFMTQTGGDVSYWNVPAETEELLSEFKADMDKLKVPYHMLPDLNTGDGCVQMLVPKEYQDLVASYMETYCSKRLSEGNLLNMDTLTALAGGEAKTGIITIPTEDEALLKEMERDFAAMHVSHHLMDDVNVGDGKRELLYARRDEQKVQQWLENFCKKHVVRGGELSAQELQNLAGNKNQVGFINIPVSESEELLPQMRAEFEMLGVNYHVMEDMRTGDGLLQIMYLKKDEAAVQNWYSNYATDRLLKGGERSYKELANLTNGKTQIVRLLVGDEVLSNLRADFDTLHINYTLLPKLNTNGEATMLQYASADASRVRSWYALYQEQILRTTGEKLPPLEQVSMGQYVEENTQITEKDYQDTEDKEQTAEVEHQIKQGEGEMRRRPLAENPDYQRLDADPDYVKITINEKLVAEDVNRHGMFVSRIPYLREYVAIPEQRVFESDFVAGTDVNKTYIAFVNKNKLQLITNLQGSVKKISADDLIAHYDKVTRDFKGQKVENMGKAVTATAPASKLVP